ncbi:MAG: hypothetical protein U0804_21025 [Gemmataceae bacterium]
MVGVLDGDNLPASTPRTRTGMPGPTSCASGKPTVSSAAPARKACRSPTRARPYPPAATAATTTTPSTAACQRDSDSVKEAPP